MSEDLKPGAFRVWNADAEKYCKPGEWALTDDGRLFNDYTTVDDEWFVVERWTGLYDRNKTPVYESDILVWDGFKYFVAWNDEDARWDFNAAPKQTGMELFNSGLDVDMLRSANVIATIHDIHDTPAGEGAGNG